MPAWLGRLLFSAGISLLVWGAYHLLKQHSLATGAKRGLGSLPLHAGAHTLLYFSTPDCAVCRSAQSPALEKLKVDMGENLQVVEINAYEQPGLARDWGILSVPATVLLNNDGLPRSINYGFTPYKKLRRQIER
jgi:thiol-disulfide isomerase/thioredoxin